MTTYNEIIKYLNDLADAHEQIRSFGVGDTWDLTEQEQYIIMWVVPQRSRIDIVNKAQYLAFTIFFLDLVHQDKSNESDVTSDTLQVATDILSQLQQPQDFTIENSPSINWVTDSHPAQLTGWELTIEIRIDYLSTHCGLPSDFEQPEPNNPCSPAQLLNTDGSYNANAPSGQPFILPDITIYKADGSVLRTIPSVKNTTIANATVENSDGSYSAEVAAEGNLEISDITIYHPDGSVLRTIPAAIDTTIGYATVENSDGSFSNALIKAESLTITPDINVTEVLGNVVVYPANKNIVTQQYSTITAQQHEDNLSIAKRQQLTRRNTLRTGQTASSAANDDAAKNIGYGPDFFTTPLNNISGNTDRFTAADGSQSFTNLIFDHATGLVWFRNGTNLRVAINENWTTAVATASALTTAGYTWFLPNIYQLLSIMRAVNPNILSSVFGLNGETNNQLWSSTTPSGATTTALVVVIATGNVLTVTNVAKTNTAVTRTFACAIFAT